TSSKTRAELVSATRSTDIAGRATPPRSAWRWRTSDSRRTTSFGSSATPNPEPSRRSAGSVRPVAWRAPSGGSHRDVRHPPESRNCVLRAAAAFWWGQAAALGGYGAALDAVGRGQLHGDCAVAVRLADLVHLPGAHVRPQFGQVARDLL